MNVLVTVLVRVVVSAAVEVWDLVVVAVVFVFGIPGIQKCTQPHFLRTFRQ